MTRLASLLLAVFLVSTAGLFAHRALAEATPLAIAAWRLGFAAAVLLAWSTVRHDATPSPGLRLWPVRLRLAFAGVCLALHFLAWFSAMQTVPIARATLLVCTTPLWATLGGRLWRRRAIPPRFWPALALAGAGTWLILEPGRSAASTSAWRGEGLAVLGAMLFAGYLLALDGLHDVVSTRNQITVTTGVAALLLLLCLAGRCTPAPTYSPSVWAALLGMALVPQLGGQTLLNAALRHFSASQVAFALLLEPVFTALLAWRLLHQPVSPTQMAGGALVLMGLALVVRRPALPESAEQSAGAGVV